MQTKARMMHVNAMSFGLSMLEYCIYSVYSGGSGGGGGGGGKPDRVLKLARFAELISSHVHTRLLRWDWLTKTNYWSHHCNLYIL
jgi:hypothetical protein